MSDTPRGVTILGATGSIGASTLDLIGRHTDRFKLRAVTAHRNAEQLAEIARRFQVELAVISDENQLPILREALAGSGISIAAGCDGLNEAAALDSDIVVAGIVGVAGLSSVLTAVRRGAAVAFANKECLVSAGDLMMREVAAHGATLLPTDSEHNAIFQVFEERNRSAIARLILTASGGPFRDWSMEKMAQATPAQAVAHPNWDMGAKISVDSATMMNKGLEVIEARYLFDMPQDRIDVLIHPQSVVHSMVEYRDGSTLAQFGPPDMRVPIASALAWPERIEGPAEKLDLVAIGELSFSEPDVTRFPSLRLAREALNAGAWAPPILNAANEVAVAAFLDGKIGFLDIAAMVEGVLSKTDAPVPQSLDDVFALDALGRRQAEAFLSPSTRAIG